MLPITSSIKGRRNSRLTCDLFQGLGNRCSHVTYRSVGLSPGKGREYPVAVVGNRFQNTACTAKYDIYHGRLTRNLIAMARKIIIDCDPGIDDAVALALALLIHDWKFWP